jgi:hypothetical protein
MPLHVLGGGHHALVGRDNVGRIEFHQRGVHIGHPLDALGHDLECLAHFFHAHKIPIEGIAVLANGNLEIEFVIDQVRIGLADVVVDPGTTKTGASQRIGNRCFRGDDADTLGAGQPDRVGIENPDVFLLPLGENPDEVPYLLNQGIGDRARKTADLHHIGRQAGATECLEDVKDDLALAETVQRHRKGADIERVRAEPDKMGRDPA